MSGTFVKGVAVRTRTVVTAVVDIVSRADAAGSNGGRTPDVCLAER
jgi:hypothetical protein